MEPLPLPTQTLYAELMEQLIASTTHRSIGNLSGSFVKKKIKGKIYFYFQYSQPGGSTKQIYIGNADPLLEKVIKQFKEQRAKAKSDQDEIAQLCSQLRAGGAMTADHASARVLRALADGGAFKEGGVLVGTHAFMVLGNNLGYSWRGAGIKTQDLDIAKETILSVGLNDLATDVPKILDSLKMGFLPVPPLNPKNPSTSFMIRGKALRVDVLTPAKAHNQKKPVPIAAWNTYAQPLPFLDYLLESPERGAVINGGGILVNVPQPARFALHKLITSGERPTVFHTKKEKDLHQASQLLRVLFHERRGDLILAWKDLKKRGKGWVKKVQVNLKKIKGNLGEDFLNIRELLS